MKWPVYALGKLVSIEKGKKPSTVGEVKSPEAQVPYVTIEAFEDRCASQYASQDETSVRTAPGDLVIVWDGARFGMIGRSIGGILGSTLAKLTPSKQVERDFLLYYLQLRLPVLRSHCRGSGIPHLDSKVLGDLPVPLPPISEQLRIVEILDQADALRRKRAEADAKAARILPALFYKMFGDPATNPRSLMKKPLDDLIRSRAVNFCRRSKWTWRENILSTVAMGLTDTTPITYSTSHKS